MNGKIFAEQGRALNEVAHPDCKVLVVGNPCNTNALICMENAPRLKRRNFHALTRLDENRGAPWPPYSSRLSPLCSFACAREVRFSSRS